MSRVYIVYVNFNISESLTNLRVLVKNYESSIILHFNWTSVSRVRSVELAPSLLQPHFYSEHNIYWWKQIHSSPPEQQSSIMVQLSNQMNKKEFLRKNNNILHLFSVRTDLLVNGAQSRLHIAGATYTDSGNYTCMMGRTASLGLELQIIPGAWCNKSNLCNM